MSKEEEQERRFLTLSEQAFPIIEQITAGMPGGFFIYQAAGDQRLIYANRALLRIFGCASLAEFQALTGYTFPGMVHPEDMEAAQRSIEQQIAAGRDDLDYVEYRILRKDGQVRWIEDYGHLVHTERYGDIFYVFVEDATERRFQALAEARAVQLAQERLEALETAFKAEQASAAKTRFLNNMSHDIRTPMNAIIGFTNLAAAHLDDLELVRSYLGKIAASSRHLLSLINDVLDMSRIESGKVVIEENMCSLPDMLQDLQAMIQTGLEEKELRFQLNAAALAHPWVVCDRLRLNQVLLNILGNALKFTPKGGSVSVSVAETEAGEPHFAVYHFCIRDTGIGMAPDFLQHIFEPFERERTSTVSGIEGTGLGMSITKNLVELMGGKIQVESEPGQGSEFICSFPFRYGAPQEEPQPAEKPAAAGPQTQTGWRLLLVEDNELNQEIAMTILEEAGCQVELAANGAEAVEMVRASAARPYDLVLMDIQMPIMDGYAATKAIRALADPELSRLPIVAMTANAFEEDKQMVIAAGMNGHVGKPIDVEKLFAVLRSLLD